MAFDTRRHGDPMAKTVLIRIVDRRDGSGAALLGQLESGPLLVDVAVDDWNRDLSPWEAPSVFGDRAFSGGAAETLDWLLMELLPALRAEAPDRAFFLGGYSLAGLFALWAAYRTDAFAGVAAVSPSVWFPGFLDACRESEPQTGVVYLSLGEREAATRQPVMATVETAIRALQKMLCDAGVPCCLEWNPGNHFQDVEQRMAKGFRFLLHHRQKQLQRIAHFEALLIRAQSTGGDPAALRALDAYYTGPDWKRDFADDAAGYLPKSLRRGVLSEDGIYNVLEAYREETE